LGAAEAPAGIRKSIRPANTKIFRICIL